jgi:serine/threonine protein kinase/uncharacterized protein YjdB
MVTEAASCNQCGHPVLSGARYCQHCGADVSEKQGIVPTAPMVSPLRSNPRLTPQPSALEILQAETLGEYEIQAELGRGGMATVYLAHDIALGRPVAVKVMSPGLVEEGVAERFRREARTAASLNHPHIIPIYAVRERPDLLYFVMKFIQGPTLDPVLKKYGPLPIPMAQLILSQAASALGYAHRRGVIHRDIKPANIMLDEDGWVVVTDFGIAKVSAATGLTMTGVTVGTPAYMSPEQCMGREVTGASDQYSLGVVAYQLITGERPFNATSAMSMMYAHFNDTPRSLRELRPDCPPDLDEAVLRMLAKDAGDRWPAIDDAFGGVYLDESTRQSLAIMASSSSNATLAATISTPTSPVPPARRSVVTPQAPGSGERPTRETEPVPATPIAPLPIGSGAADAGYLPPHLRPPGPPPAPRRAPGEEGSQALPGRKRTWLLGGFLGFCVLLAVVLIRQRPATIGSAPPAPVPASVDSGVPDGGAARNDSAPAPVIPVGPEPPAPVAVADVVLTPARVALEVGRSVRVRVELRDAGGARILEPRPVAWASSAATVAVVSENGTVRALAPGRATITATVDGHGRKVEVEVPAPVALPPRPAPVASVVLSPADATLPVGSTVALSAFPLGAGGVALPDRPITWSSNSSAVTVSPLGLVTAVQPGVAVVRAESEGQSGVATITVQPVAVAEVRLSLSADSLLPGKTVQLVATPRDARGSPVPDRRIKWESSDTSVAAVVAGLVTARRPGAARITATADDRSAAAQITVLPPPVDPAVERARAEAEIRRTLEAFAQALNGRSVAQLKQAYPGMSSSEEGRWRNMLEEKSLVRLVASVEAEGDPKIEPDAAESRFRLVLLLTYSGRPVHADQVEYRAQFRRDGTKWVLSRLQQQ